MHGNYQNRLVRNKPEPPKAVVVPVEGDIPEKTTESTISPKTTSIAAFVTGCAKLNVRERPDIKANIVAVISVKTEVVVDLGSSTDEFYKVCNAAGIEGFCVKKYIELKQ